MGYGQFVSLYTNDKSKILPRPISLCEIDKENGRLHLVYRVTGQGTGTDEFSQMKAGASSIGMSWITTSKMPE